MVLKYTNKLLWITSFLVFYNTYLYYNNNTHEQHRSDRRSLTPNHHEHKKRKESNIKLNESKKKLSTFHSDNKRKHRPSSSHTDKKSLKPEFDDARLFCDDCNQFYDNICPHHKQSYIPDKKVRTNFD
jgi:hypothetical protein